MGMLKALASTIATTCAFSLVIASADVSDVHSAELAVRFALGPYFDYQPWVLAHDLGFDKEQGVDLQLRVISATGEGVAAMRQGSLDAVFSGLSVDFPFYKSVPTLRSWIVPNQFSGFIIVGRKGRTETFASLEPKVGAEKAKEQILNSFRGRTFSVVLSQREQMLTSAFSQIGMTPNDVKFADFPDDAQAALAFEKGVGDYYMGGLPQETKLLASPDKFVNVGGTEILGPAGLWYTSMDSLEPWLQAHHDTMLKLVAIWYRTMRYMKEKPEVAIPEMTKAINEAAAANFSPEDVAASLKLLDFRTIEEAQKTQYNPNSPIYWKRAVDFYATLNSKDLPDHYDPTTFVIAEAVFNEFLQHKDLVDWVNSPLK
jgi:ABC-type nitrate/sulfonate/bicarbonate transport system substrate-binding protein